MADTTGAGAYSTYPTVTNKLMPPPDPMQSMGQAIGVAQGIQGLTAAQFDLAHKQLATVNSLMAQIAQDPSDQTIANVAATAANMKIPPNVIAQEVTTLAGLPPDQRKQRALQHISTNLDAAGQLTAAVGAPGTRDTGDATISTLTSPVTGAVTQAPGNAAVVLHRLSPEAKAARIGVVGPNGASSSVPQSSVVTPYGTALPSPQAAVPGTGAAAAMAPAGVQTGAGTPAPSSPSIPGALPTSLAPGVTEAANIYGGQSGRQFSDDAAAATKYQNTIAPLQAAIPALERLGPTGTGPGTETLNQMKSFIQSAGIPGVDASKIKDYDEAKKYLTQYVNQTGNSGTNDKLAASFAGNPSTGISNAAAVDVAKTALALRRMQQAQVMQAQQQGIKPSDYANWATQWNTQQDPRAYGFDMMSADAQKKLLSGMSDADKAKFVASLRAAHSSQLLSAPNAGR